jgi:DNA polymerase I
VRDFRIENALFWPHMRNVSYEAFFEQSTNTRVDPGDTDVVAASMWEIEREIIHHPILKLEYDVSRVLAEMEVTGVYIDHEALKSLEIQLMQTIEAIEDKVMKETGGDPINLASPQQLQKLLFETMKIKPIKKTKTGWSTDEETLAILAKDHEICQDIITHRQASKLL